MRVKELKESSKFILFVNGKPAAQYQDSWEAITMLKHLKAKFPEKEFSVEKETCATDKIAEGVPQPGPSSGAPKQFGSDAKIQTRQMTVKDIISSVPGVPYYNNVVDDWDAKDYSWGVTKKVIEYATYLKDHPDSLAKLPPAIVLNGKFEDGAHRVSAIWLLQQRMDPKNPLWKSAKLNVQFVQQDVTEDAKSAEEIKIPGASGWYGIENTDEGVILYGEDVEIEGDDERPTGWIDFQVNINTGENRILADRTDTNAGYSISDYLYPEDLDEIINEIVAEFKDRYGETWDEIQDELHGGMEIDRD